MSMNFDPIDTGGEITHLNDFKVEPPAGEPGYQIGYLKPRAGYQPISLGVFDPRTLTFTPWHAVRELRFKKTAR